MMYTFNLFQFVETYFMSQQLVCVKECFLCTWKKMCLLYMSAGFVLCFKSFVFTLTFGLVVLSIVEHGVEEFLITILLSISPFSSLDVCFIYLFTPVLGICPFTAMISSWWSIFVFCHGFVHSLFGVMYLWYPALFGHILTVSPGAHVF